MTAADRRLGRGRISAKMRLIIDTNQASRYVDNAACRLCTVVVPPLVWAEILAAPSGCRQRSLEAIGKHTILFGMDMAAIHDRLRDATEDEIRAFDPVSDGSSCEHTAARLNFLSPRPELFERANQLKRESLQFSAIVDGSLKQNAQERRALRSRGEKQNAGCKFETIDEADCRLISGEDAPVRKQFVDDVTEGGARTIRALSHDSFYSAVLENPAFRRFLRYYLTLLLAFGDCWADEELNRVGPSRKRNDITDMMLPLYARDGDAIVTCDGYFRKAFRFIDPGEKVRLAEWDEL
jgi:hypothetical protein